jgi:hypothetical protein
MARLAALVPKPRVKLTPFHDVFESDSKHGTTMRLGTDNASETRQLQQAQGKR